MSHSAYVITVLSKREIVYTGVCEYCQQENYSEHMISIWICETFIPKDFVKVNRSFTFTKKIHSYSRHIFLIKSILACFLAFSEKVTENFASQFARTEAVLLIIVNDVCDAVLSLHRSLLVLPVGVRSSNVEKSFLFIAQRNSRFQLYCFTLGFAGGFTNKTNPGGGGGHSLIWPIRGRAAEQGMVFGLFCPEQGMQFYVNLS